MSIFLFRQPACAGNLTKYLKFFTMCISMMANKWCTYVSCLVLIREPWRLHKQFVWIWSSVFVDPSPVYGFQSIPLLYPYGIAAGDADSVFKYALWTSSMKMDTLIPMFPTTCTANANTLYVSMSLRLMIWFSNFRWKVLSYIRQFSYRRFMFSRRLPCAKYIWRKFHLQNSNLSLECSYFDRPTVIKKNYALLSTKPLCICQLLRNG